jgi:hypothetical protein
MKFSEFQPINEAPRINAGPAYPKPGTAQTPAPQIPPTKDEIKRGLNQVPDGDSGATISQAGKTRRNRSAARRDAQDDASRGKGFLPTSGGKGQAGTQSNTKMAHSFPTQQAKKDAALSMKKFATQQDARMTAKTGITQPKIPGAERGEGFIDPSVIRDQQKAAANDKRASVVKSKYNDNSKLPSKPKQKYT